MVVNIKIGGILYIMNEMFQYNTPVANTDATLSAILSKFNYDFIKDLVEDSIANRYRSSGASLPNIVLSYEEQYKNMVPAFASSLDVLNANRNEVYATIIEIFKDKYNLNIAIDDDTDIYTATFYLYDFLVANFSKYMAMFFAMYIIKEKDQLYKVFDLSNTDPNIMYYSKKLFSDDILSHVHANLGKILYGIGSFDIDIYMILTTVYMYDLNIAHFVYGLIRDSGNFFKDHYYSYILNDAYAPSLITDIKLLIHNIAGVTYDVKDFIKNNSSDNKENKKEN